MNQETTDLSDWTEGKYNSDALIELIDCARKLSQSISLFAVVIEGTKSLDSKFEETLGRVVAVLKDKIEIEGVMYSPFFYRCDTQNKINHSPEGKKDAVLCFYFSDQNFSVGEKIIHSLDSKLKSSLDKINIAGAELVPKVNFLFYPTNVRPGKIKGATLISQSISEAYRGNLIFNYS